MIIDLLFVWFKFFKLFDYNFDFWLSFVKSKWKVNLLKKIYGFSLYWRLMKRIIIIKKLMLFVFKMILFCIIKMFLWFMGLVNEKCVNYEFIVFFIRINIYLL